MAVYGNLSADQGAFFSSEIYMTDVGGSPLNLTGYTVSAQARRSYGSSTGYSFLPTITDVTGGVCTLSMTGAQTDLLKGRYVYDIEITDSTSRKFRVIEGQFSVAPGATRT